MSIKKELQKQLEEYGIIPNKILGQNFLIDSIQVDALISSCEFSQEDIVVEVGPGTGTITKELSKKVKKVIAIEKDPQMVQILKNELGAFKNVEIINEDILNIQITDKKSQKTNKSKKLILKDYKLVGAPPYYLTARLFRKFLEEIEKKPTSVCLIIQKEVAKKITQKPPKMSLLSASVQVYGNPKITKIIKKNYFWPVPKVDSAILNIKNIRTPAFNEKKFFQILKAGFSSPRKQLVVNLSKNFNLSKKETKNWLLSAEIEPKRRAETLCVGEWENILNTAP